MKFVGRIVALFKGETKYPVEPPRGIFHFPQGIFCLVKQEDTGKESVKITRLSGREFELEITPTKLSKAEKQDYPIRITETQAVATEDPEKEPPKEVIKSEERIDLTTDNTHRISVQDGDIVRIGNTITYTAGTNLITLDDSAGAGDSWNTAYTMEDVLSNCGAVVTKQGASAYDVSARMLFLSGVYFVSESEFVELKPNPINPVYTIDADAGSHVRIGDYDSDDDYCHSGSFWRIYINACTGTRLNRFDGELLVYGSNIWTDGASYVDSLNFWGTTRIFDTEMEGNAYISGEDINFQRVTWMGKHTQYDMLYASGYDFPWAGIKAMNCQKGIFLSGTVSSPIDLYDVTIVDCTSSVYVSGDELMRIINSSFDRATTSVPANRIGIQECYTFNVLVTDASNGPLSGALVALKDKDDLPIFSICTGADGKLPTDQIVKAWENNHNVKTDFNDHKLKITLNGYSDYETEIEIDHKIEGDQVCLDALTYSYDNIMTALNDVKGTGFVKDTHSLPQCLTATGFATQNPPSQNLDAYKATGFSTHAPADTADAVWDELLAGHALAGSTGKALSNAYTLGSGAITFTYTLLNSVDSAPIPDADVWATSDLAGNNLLASGRTDQNGEAAFYLDAGTVYVWRQKSGWNFDNPDTEVVA